MLSYIRWRSVLAFVSAHLAVAIPASGDLLIVSGDTTPIFYLTDLAPNSATEGNQAFFLNVLGPGNSVAVVETSASPQAVEELDAYYSNLPGVSSTILTSPVSVGDLATTDLLIAAVPDDAFSAAEIDAIRSLLEAGGRILLTGEAGSLNLLGGLTAAQVNGHVNDLLSSLESGISLDNTDFDQGTFLAQGNQIEANALTAGVTALDYGFVSGVSGGTVLFRSDGGAPFVAVVPEPAAGTLAVLCSLSFLAARRSRAFAGERLRGHL